MRVHWYCRRHFWKFQQAFARKVYRDSTPEVLHGPFAGMKYFNRVVWGPLTPKWIGSYECELWDIVEEIVRRSYPTVIDVGCAEGYYAVGLAWRMPSTRVHAFDLDCFARRQVRALAELNRVSDRLVVEAECTHEVLRELIHPKRTLLVVDIEGAELQLLDPDACPRLRSCDILVECHAVDEDRPAAVAEAIAGRFAATHDGKTVWARDRCVGDWTAGHERLQQLELQSLSIGLQELRSEPQVWLWMTSLAGANESQPG